MFLPKVLGVLSGLAFLAIVAAGTENVRAAVGTCNREGDFLSDDTDCATFYTCDATLAPVIHTCPAGYLFDPSINICTPNYICPLAPDPCLMHLQRSSITHCQYPFQEMKIKNQYIHCLASQVCRLPGEVLPNFEDCSKYFVCTAAGVDPVEIQCIQGQFFNIAAGVCQDSTQVDCGSRPGCLYEAYSIPNVYDCSAYYLCDAALVPQPKICEPLFLYDSITHVCVIASQATCAQP